MKYWEFLIQKEGDETWLPLETQQVEILEGRYRVVAHTDRVNAPIDIRVSQMITDEMPPRQRVRKRTSTISESGLVVVMPFVHLKPGQWNLKCSSVNVMDDLMGDGWQYSVELQVFAETDEDWSGEWPVPTDAEAVSSLVEVEDDNAGQSVGHPLVQAQAKLQARQQSQGELPEPDPDAHVSEAAYHIHLKQQAFLARPNQAMTIMGQVQALVTLSPEETASQLWLRLQNPDTAQVIMEAHRPLSLARLPADFKVKIQLPGNVTTRVVLGEVSLRTPAVGDQPSQLLSASAFTITAGIAQLLDDLANQDPGIFDDEVSVSADANGAIQGAIEDHSSIAVPALDAMKNQTAPAVGVVMPPQLVRPLDHDSYRPVSAEVGAEAGAEIGAEVGAPAMPAPDMSAPDVPVPDVPAVEEPELPIFPAPAAATNGSGSLVPPAAQQRPALVSQPAQFMGTSIEDDDIEASQIAALLEDIDSDLTADESVVDTLEPPGIEGVLPELEASPDSKEASPTAAKLVSRSVNKPQNRFHQKNAQKSERQAEVSAAFRSLKRKDNFWNKLSSLTHEGRKEATELAANMEAAGVSPTANPRADVGDRTPSPLISPQSKPASNEVVIFNDPAPAPPPPPDQLPNQLPTQLPKRSAAEIAAEISRTQATNIASGQNGISTTGVNGLTPSPAPFSPEAFSPEDVPEMALPVISVPVGNLVAGSTVTVTVRTRPSLYKPFIKLWMIDRQSRTLVGDPQLLTNLRPDALGDLETRTDLRVPMGCLDVQIAAIAVDMATQQESNKAIVNRHVVPANQSRSSIRGLNF